MARTFVLWLHGLGDSGPANEPIKSLFKSPEFMNTKWLFPSAPPNPVSCNYGMVMPSWFDIRELPLTAGSPNDESSVLEAVKNVHAIIDKEIAGGIKPENLYICGFSQGGALTLASVLLYPKTLGGGAVFSGWVPFNSSIINQFTKDAIKTPILWSHGIDDKTVLFEAGQAALPFLQQAAVTCEFKVEEEEQKKEIEQEASAAELSDKRAQVEEKPDMNDVPMEDNQQEEEKTVRQDLNESTKDSGLNLNANDVDSENNPSQ